MERKKTKMINGKEYKRGKMTYTSRERADAYAKLLRDKGMNAIVDNFKEKKKYNNISYTHTYYFYWLRKKKKS